MTAICLLAGIALLSVPASAEAIIAGFEELGPGPVPDGYKGITWGGNWYTLTFDQYPYEAHSGTHSAFAAPFSGEYFLDFNDPIYFVGAYFSLVPSNQVYFNLYSDGQLVHTSVILKPCVDAFPGNPVCDNAPPGTNPARFLPSGYYKERIDRVGIVSYGHGFYVMDDLVYGTGPDTQIPDAPEPSAAFLLAGGLGGLYFLHQRRRNRSCTPNVS